MHLATWRYNWAATTQAVCCRTSWGGDNQAVGPIGIEKFIAEIRMHFDHGRRVFFLQRELVECEIFVGEEVVFGVHPEQRPFLKLVLTRIEAL